ncbi:MAG: radical SAM protein [Deltaproteobacteria bacterium]|nr:radical SAM protein [Deltaproteobacteria bacterium]
MRPQTPIRTRPSAILINPWIHDFAAYDLWSKPLGLLYLAGHLRARGFQVRILDCLDVHHPALRNQKSSKKLLRRAYGTGKFFRERIDPPPALAHVGRSYHRYGMPPPVFLETLGGMKRPDVILVTSLMTYWYPGVREAVRLARTAHPGVPILLGGLYTRLCPEHAALTSGADRVVPEPGFSRLPQIFSALGVPTGSPPPPGTPILPAYDLLQGLDYVCLLTSTGCPLRCRYCAGPYLNPRLEQRSPADVVDEILHWHIRFGVRDFAFYDDALLVGHDSHLAPILRRLIDEDLSLRFHTPNALHIKEIRPGIAGLMFRAGFRTLRLGLETSDPALHRRMGGKVNPGDFERALDILEDAGFMRSEIGAYILTGLPGQSAASVHETLDLVEAAGASPYLSEYSPIPHTSLWAQALESSRYNLAEEPLYHNNTEMICGPLRHSNNESGKSVASTALPPRFPYTHDLPQVAPPW